MNERLEQEQEHEQIQEQEQFALFQRVFIAQPFMQYQSQILLG
jgi:hypothetical protein